MLLRKLTAENPPPELHLRLRHAGNQPRPQLTPTTQFELQVGNPDDFPDDSASGPSSQLKHILRGYYGRWTSVGLSVGVSPGSARLLVGGNYGHRKSSTSAKQLLKFIYSYHFVTLFR